MPWERALPPGTRAPLGVAHGLGAPSTALESLLHPLLLQCRPRPLPAMPGEAHFLWGGLGTYSAP